jgi:simple sugar transport system permease protein
MWQRTKTFLLNNGTLLFTILIFVIGYFACGRIYPAMQKPQVFFNLFINNASLLLLAIGMTFVVISNGIDLSVASMLALTTMATAMLLKNNVSPFIVMPLMLVMGVSFGSLQGFIIHKLKVEAFVVTLMGSFFCRGMAYIISLTSVTITNPAYKAIGMTKVLIPGFEKAYVYLYSVVAIVIFLAAIYIARYTRFGRTMYAIGNNEQSARLMGLPVERTRILVYAFSGFCSSLGGIAFSLALLSGYGQYAPSMEMDAIASVVMGGTLLTGGVGNVIGTLFGVLINGTIVSVLQFNGTLSSWWTRIGVGVLTLFFIGIQMLFQLGKKSSNS